jgi:hypothetical protein
MPITVNYTRMADPMTDAEAMRFAERLARVFDSNARYDVSNEIAILTVRVLVAEGKLNVKTDPIDIEFESKHVGTLNEEGKLVDGQGKVVGWPVGFCDFHFQLQMRGENAQLQKKLNKMGDEFQQGFTKLYLEWIRENVMEILTPGTVFYLAPDAAHKKEIQDMDRRQKLTVTEWIEDDKGMLYLACEKGNIPAPNVAPVCFDANGEKHIMVQFNQEVALAKLGIKPEEF